MAKTKKEIIVSAEDIKEFNAEKVASKNNNLYDFLKNKYDKKNTVEIKPILTQNLFNDKIDLSNVNFEGCKFDNVIFNSENVTLTDANFAGATLGTSRFIHNIKLDGVNFGPIKLSSKMFQSADISKAKFDPTNSNIFMYPVSDKQLKNYIKVKNTNNNNIGSLNNYLASTLRHKYPANAIIIADFSNKTIDNLDLSNANFSGSNFSGTKFSNITSNNVIFRDCEFDGAVFSNLVLEQVDFRGSCLTKVTGKAKISNSKFNLSQSDEIGVAFDEDNFADTGIGPAFQDKTELGFISKDISIIDAELDPCYVKGSINAEILPLKKVLKNDIDAYLFGNKDKSFKEFYKERYNLNKDIKDFTPDFSRFDLSGMDLSNSNFSKCNFAYVDLTGANLENANFEGSNFTGANLSGKAATKFLGWTVRGKDQYVSAKNTNFNDCNFTLAKFDYINLKDAKMNNVIAKSASLVAAILEGATASNAVFKYGNLNYVKATGLNAPKANFESATVIGGNLKGANLSKTNFDNAKLFITNLSEADLSHASLVNTNLMLADLRKANLRGAKLAANINGAKLEGANLEDCDISGLFQKNVNMINVNVEPAINSHKKNELQEEKKSQEETEALFKTGEKLWNLAKTYIPFIYDISTKYLPKAFSIVMKCLPKYFSENKKLYGFCILASIIAVPMLVSAALSLILPAIVVSTAVSILSLPLMLGAACVGSAIGNTIAESLKANDEIAKTKEQNSKSKDESPVAGQNRTVEKDSTKTFVEGLKSQATKALYKVFSL